MRHPLRLGFLLAILLTCGLRSAMTQVVLPPHGDRSVHDLAGVIRQDHIQTMERLHKELFEKTGVAITIVTVPTLEGELIEDFAVRVGEEWGAGRRGEDRGIVFAVAVQERRIFIATGYGVEGYLPDGRVGRIVDQYAIPYLRQNDYSTGILQTSAALVSASAEEHGVTIEGATPRATTKKPSPSRDSSPLGTVFKILGFLFLAYLFIRHPMLFILLMSGGGRGGGGFSGGGFGGSGGGGFGGFGGGGFGGGGAGRSF